ncbi:MAG: tyrosine-protein phosphatase [Parachlamydia sp.]|nr:tyrosine-protein phosphatase [Parachlamydia sp.]
MNPLFSSTASSGQPAATPTPCIQGWRKRRINPAQQVIAAPVSPPSSPEPERRFKIDWALPTNAAKIQDAAACALPAPAASTPPKELITDLAERYRNIKDPLNRRMDDMERFEQFPQAMDNQIRNRYGDVLPTPVDLVTLAHPTNLETSYINASKFHDMILTQGPIKNYQVDTVADFWMMTFEQGKDIVCLTDHMGLDRNKNLVEKTFPYWQPLPADPANPVVYRKKLGSAEVNFEVRLVEGPTNAFPADRTLRPQDNHAYTERVTKRVFQISLNGQVKRVNHWHFENWKDNCVCNSMLLARLIDRLSNPVAISPAVSPSGSPWKELAFASNDSNSDAPNETSAPGTFTPGTVIVHCSAGIGRTGVFAVARHFIERYREGGSFPTHKEIDNAVLELRQRRPGSVQNADQLELIEKAIGSYRKLGYVQSA